MTISHATPGRSGERRALYHFASRTVLIFWKQSLS